MGADIYFRNGEYFRDSYNLSNLAWVIGESYWNNARKTKADQNKFMEKLANITDEQIEKYVKTKVRKEIKSGIADESESDWEKMFKEKRNQLKKLLNKKQLKVKEWSV